MLNLNLIKKINFFIILIILIGILFRFFYFLNVEGWFDEWNMLYTIDPSVSMRILGKDTMVIGEIIIYQNIIHH